MPIRLQTPGEKLKSVVVVFLNLGQNLWNIYIFYIALCGIMLNETLAEIFFLICIFPKSSQQRCNNFKNAIISLQNPGMYFYGFWRLMCVSAYVCVRYDSWTLSITHPSVLNCIRRNAEICRKNVEIHKNAEKTSRFSHCILMAFKFYPVNQNP